MSNKSKRNRRSPLGGYIGRARRDFPDYVDKRAPCDVPDCSEPVDGGRTLTWVMGDGTPFTILSRLCAEHIGTRIDDLLKQMPALKRISDAAGPAPYMDLRDDQ
jgi:hypothetical protein